MSAMTTADQSGEQLTPLNANARIKAWCGIIQEVFALRTYALDLCCAEQRDRCPPQLGISFVLTLQKPGLPFQANCAPQKTPRTKQLEKFCSWENVVVSVWTIQGKVCEPQFTGKNPGVKM